MDLGPHRAPRGNSHAGCFGPGCSCTCEPITTVERPLVFRCASHCTGASAASGAAPRRQGRDPACSRGQDPSAARPPSPSRPERESQRLGRQNRPSGARACGASSPKRLRSAGGGISVATKPASSGARASLSHDKTPPGRAPVGAAVPETRWVAAGLPCNCDRSLSNLLFSTLPFHAAVEIVTKQQGTSVR